jgi:hypothetical protein
MTTDGAVAEEKVHKLVRVTACAIAALLLPPFVVLAIAPMLLALIPVAMVGLPFLIPAMMSGSLAAGLEERRRAGNRQLKHLRLVYP